MSGHMSSRIFRPDMPPPSLPRPATSGRAAAAPEHRARPGPANASQQAPSTVPVVGRRAARMRSASGEGLPRVVGDANRPRLGSWAFKYTPTSAVMPAASAKEQGVQGRGGPDTRKAEQSLSEEDTKNDSATTMGAHTPIALGPPTAIPAANPSRIGTKHLSIDVPSQSLPNISSPKRSAEHSPWASTPTQHSAPGRDSTSTPTSTLSERRASVFSSDTDPLLRLIAARERRVLELKEEMAREEAELAKLKTQWASQEARRKRSEMRRAEPMRAMHSPHKSSHGSFPAAAAGQSRGSQDSAETDASGTTARPTTRTKFEGGRHLRALTLTGKEGGSSQATSANGTPRAGTPSPPLDPASAPAPRRASRDQSRDRDRPVPAKTAHPANGPGAAGTLMGDLRENLWTFIEDLKQATVGEEATVSPGKAPPPVKTNGANASPVVPPRMDSLGKRASMPPPRTKGVMAGSAASTPTPRPQQQPRPPPRPPTLARTDLVDEDADAWGIWESPVGEGKTPSPVSAEGFSGSEVAWSSPRTSTSSNAVVNGAGKEPTADGDTATWRPAAVMSSFSPRELTKRASSFMSDWERSLASPGPGEGIVAKGGKGD